MLTKLLAAKVGPVITDPIHVCFKFIFNDFFTKKNEQRRTLPDLSNLVQLPEDVLQKAGIIQNDSQIMSLDGSRRLPGSSNYLEIYIWKFIE